MMKKLGLFVFVMALVVAFALPAFAYTVEGAKGERFTIGGSLRYDIGFRGTNKDYNTKVSTIYGTDDRVSFFSDLSQSTNIMTTFTVGPVSGTAVLVTQSSNEAYHKQVNDSALNAPYSMSAGDWNNTGFNQKDNGFFDVVYGTYTFGAMSLQAGKMAPLTVAYAPSSGLAYSLGAGGTIVGIAYGFVYDNKAPMIRFNHSITKMVNYTIALVATGTYAEDLKVAPSTTPVLRESYAQLPAIAARVNLNFGVVAINPGFLYQQVKWNNLPSGWDDSMTSWFFRLPVRMTFGPFTATVEGLYGQNLGGLNSNFTTVCASESAYGAYARNAAGKILNGNTQNVWFDLAYKVGPVTPHLFYGQTRSYNNDRYLTGDNGATRSFYGINAFYSVTPNFMVVPEFAVYDLDRAAGLTNYKLGGQWFGGVQFQFNF